MEEGGESRRYWCHQCSRSVQTITEAETIKCSLCYTGFVEELDTARGDNHHRHLAGDSDSDRALSLWAPILLGMMSNPRRRGRFRQIEPAGNNENEDHNDSQLETFVRHRRQNSITILQLLQGILAGMITESDYRNRDRERVTAINPFDQTIIVQGAGGGGNPFDSAGPQRNQPIGLLGDYFVGPGLDLFLQHLAENNPTQHGTPPTRKKAVLSIPTVRITEGSVQCCVCFEEFEVGNEAKELPCKHKFHDDCILPWLNIHSSCPVCRYQLPSDDSKLEASHGIMINGLTRPENQNGESGEGVDMEGGNSRRFSVTLPLPWPFNSLFSSTPSTQITNPNFTMITSTPLGSERRGHEDGEGGQREDDH
ncbi:hypothetical protein R6Q59_011837 [Mikania micrantha]|uniref:RING-type E3 ubiquitin transferase n=1 Tax=Mikania micrantha TaxID=192012 RepID=A0A5N6N2P3_9ASTR|nr:hypothetical protein E3N88_24350 [Mikania micrantha]